MEVDDLEAQLALLHGEDATDEEVAALGAGAPNGLSVNGNGDSHGAGGSREHSRPGSTAGDAGQGGSAVADLFGEDQVRANAHKENAHKPKKPSGVEKKSNSHHHHHKKKQEVNPKFRTATDLVSSIAVKVNSAEKKKKKENRRSDAGPGPNSGPGTGGDERHKKPPSSGPSSAQWKPIAVNDGAGPSHSGYIPDVGGLGERHKKAARESFASAAVTPPVSKKREWECAFCRKGSHFAGLGDLFGPHMLSKRVRRSHAELQMVKEELWFHEPCVYWAPGVYVFPYSDELVGITDCLQTCASKLCVSCGEPGACVTCIAKQCEKSYHLPCAYAADCDLNDDTLQLHCRNHKSTDSKPESALPKFLEFSPWKP